MSLRAVLSGLLLTASLAPGHASAQPGALAGTWVLDRQASQIPREVGFAASFLPSPRADGAASSDRRGTPTPALRPQGESFEDGQRRQRLTDEVRTPPSPLTIVESPDSITFSDDRGGSRTVHPDGRAEALAVAAVPLLTTARRDNGTLVVLYAVADLRQLRYTYSRVENPPQLIVEVQFIERGVTGDTARLVYGRPAPRTAPAATGAAADATTPDGSTPASGTAPAPVPRAGSEFTGLTRLGLVVEEPGQQAVGCGLTKAGLEAAVSKPFTDVGLRVAANSDEDTYVYVTIMTSTMPTGMCISRYDWSINSTTEATLSYQRRPLLAQVVLARKGGLTGSMPTAHAADVIRGLSDGLTQIAAIIRDANR
ncbi:MAG TPA: hypothetical protein VM032_15035 [Vicinamibacterales bacterium]|nr:hypothetical protein [Vicinamibacterales bacterium]